MFNPDTDEWERKRVEVQLIDTKAMFTLGVQAPAQNGTVFRHMVPNLKICSHSKKQAHAHYCKILGKAQPSATGTKPELIGVQGT